jgi:lipid kinase YegS
MTRMRIILHGKSSGNAPLRTAVRRTRAEGHTVEVRVTWEPGDVERLTVEAIREGGDSRIDCIVAGGGDGTVNEVFAAAYSAGLPPTCSLGVLPLGTANDFARSAGIPGDDVAASLRIAATNAPRSVDAGLINGRLFVNLLSGGFGSRVTAETDPALKKQLGRLAYAVTGIARFAELSANRGAFRADNFEWEGDFLALAIGNGRCAGGGIPLCPDALLDDGLLDLTIIPALDRTARFGAFSHLLREGAASLRTTLLTARSSWITYESEQNLNVNLDGEPAVLKSFRVEAHHRVLPVRLGATAALMSSGAQLGKA